VVGFGKGVGVGVSNGFNDIGTGERVVAGSARFGEGVASTTVGVAEGGGVVFVDSDDLEHEQRSRLTRARKRLNRIFIPRRMLCSQCLIKPIWPPLQRGGAYQLQSTSRMGAITDGL
jgi:hypothetical protein